MTRGASHRIALLAVLTVAAAARVFYYVYAHVRFDARPLDDYFQFVDPLLLKNDLVESVLHLHSQPPLFNLFLGAVLKACPVRYALAFNLLYVGFGAVVTLSMFHLVLRLGVGPRLAATVAGAFAISPVTMLYENWLYSTYPVAMLLTLAALLLHRFVSHEQRRDAVGFFAVLAVVVLTRAFYHPTWFLLVALTLLAAMPSARTRTTLALAVPLAVVLGISVHQHAEFGALWPGAVYQKINLAQMTTLRLSAEKRERLIRSGSISPINRLSIYGAKPGDYAPYVEPAPPTGVAVLDQEIKSTGAANWHSATFKRVADQYGKDAFTVLRNDPGTYLASVSTNLGHVFRPADQSYPFPVADLDARMRSLTRAWDVVVAGQARYEGIAVFNIVALAGSVVFALVFFGRWFVRRKRPRVLGDRRAKANALVVLFITSTFVYVGAITVALSSDDHSRYRFETAPLMTVLLAMALSTAWVHVDGRRYWTKG